MKKLHAFVLGAAILGTCFSASNGFSQSFLSQKENALVKVKDKVPLKSYSFPLQDVKITRSPFTNAMQKDSAYLMLLNPNRLLYRFYKNAGLPPKDSIYGGWESDGLSGHTLGHYLSALSMMYVSTGQVAFKKRINYIVSELESCQKARGTGYVGAIPKEDSIFAQVARGQIKSSGFDLNGGWSPWYTVHKVMAGLCDAYLYADNKKALDVVVKMADWTYNTVNHLSDSVRLKMLNCEYGGMNDVLANIYSFTGNKKYLDLSYKFYDEFVMGKLAKKIDPLPGKHSNTNVPKAIGSARQFELTGNESDKTIASFFWSTMVNHHSYVIGGNSNYEYCGQADSLSDRLSDNTCETCNTYNMLKLTRHLFGWQPDSKLMDYYERALYNHILASQNPETGMMCYFVPLRMGTQKQFSDSFNTFTCCVGSGIENHSKYGESIYGDGNDGSLFVNLFIPSVLNWKAKQAKIQLATTFPHSESILITVSQLKPKRLQIRIRKPFWLKGEAVISVNQKPIKAIVDEFGYWLIDRTFGTNDRIQVTTPMGVYTEAMPDNPNRVAFKYGPIVLAGVLGKEQPDPVYGIPVLLTNNRNAAEWLTADSKNLVFQMKGVGQPKDVTLIPFYKTYDQYYSVYWDFFTKDAWTQLQATYEAEKKRQAHVESITIDNFRIGEMQPERDHQLKASERSYVDAALGRTGREARAQNYFEFVMKVNPGEKNSLLCTYIGDDKDRNFDIKVNGKLLTTVNWKGGQTGKFYDFVYPIPSDVLGTGTTITVRVEANYGKTAGRIFGVRTIKE